MRRTVAEARPLIDRREIFMAKRYGSRGVSGTTNIDMGVPQVHRGSMSPHESKAHFRKHAVKTHVKNMPPRMPMRGGIRL